MKTVFNFKSPKNEPAFIECYYSNESRIRTANAAFTFKGKSTLFSINAPETSEQDFIKIVLEMAIYDLYRAFAVEAIEAKTNLLKGCIF